jgi:two-component SAPR family response regulator
MAAMLALRHRDDNRSYAAPSVPAAGLRVHALGPLRIELDGVVLRQLGGEKAGARQAVGVFAFLLDRAQMGASKHEILDLVWPDVECDRADLAFHRTLLGLRQTLVSHGLGPVICFERDRYRLHAGLVDWTDVSAFEWLVEQPASDPERRARDLVAAVDLYRGDYLDDCPYYGDSGFVERTRSLLRSTVVDALDELGELRQARGEITAARRCFRRAEGIAQGELSTVGPIAVIPASELGAAARRRR